MKRLNLTNNLSILFTILMLGAKINAQEIKTTVEQDVKFENLLKEKQKINATISIMDNYKIQIFYGSVDASKKILNDFKREFMDMEGTIVYSNPTYKVLVGNYDSRLEAKKALQEITNKYPNALLIEPGK